MVLIECDHWDVLYLDRIKIEEEHDIAKTVLVRRAIEHGIAHFARYMPDDTPAKDDAVARYWYHGQPGDEFDWSDGWWDFPAELDADVWERLTAR
jgi:hypothetical protein